MYKYLLLLFLTFLIGSSLFCQNPARSGKDYAVFFYTTTFRPGWESLPDTKTDAIAIAKELKENYGFLIEYVPNPKKEDIENKIIELNSRNYGPKDQLLLFFSMHGHFLASADRGYLIPSDGKIPSRDALGKSWLSYDDLGAYLALNPCQHILLSLDACYSGAFGDRWMSYPGSVSASPEAECKARETNALYHPGRLYFTSGSRERRVPAQSRFAKSWLRALRDGRSKKIMDTNELRYYFGTVPDPKPEGGSFTKDHKGGDFIFIHKTACGHDQRPSQDKQHWQSLQTTFSQQKLLGHLNKYPGCPHYQEALRLLTENKETDSSAPVDLLNMVFVKGGTFQMGSEEGEDDEKPVHSITVSDFYINSFEVTVKEYLGFVNATNTHFPEWMEKDSDYNVQTGTKDRYRRLGDPLTNEFNPIVGISWNDAVAYCNWRSGQDGLQKVYAISKDKVTADWDANGYRLPTEAEWEFAARSRRKDEKWAGTSKESELASFANGSGSKDGHEYTAPVGSFNANALGLYDMNGNVWECCWDWKGTYPSSSRINPHSSDSGSFRVVRGGSWSLSTAYLRYSDGYCRPDFRSNDMGFRLARSAP